MFFGGEEEVSTYPWKSYELKLSTIEKLNFSQKLKFHREIKKIILVFTEMWTIHIQGLLSTKKILLYSRDVF